MYCVFFTKVLAPSLEHFNIDCSLVDWMPGAAPVSLATLLVVNSRFPYAVTSVESVVDVLACLPLLERLELTNVLESVSAQAVSTPPHKKAALPYVRRLFVTAPATSCARLLESLSLSVAQVTMNLDMDSMDNISLMAAVPILTAFVQDISPDTVAIREHPGNSKFDMFVYQRPVNSNTGPFMRIAGTTAVRDHRVTPVHTLPLATALCHNMLTYLPLESVTTCLLHTNASRTDPIWDAIAQALPKVNVLATPAFPVPTELQAIVTTLGLASQCEGSGIPKYRMASVTQLSLYNVRFRTVGHKTAPQELIDLLSSRREAGCPQIQRVTLGACVNMREADVESLREYVQDVDRMPLKKLCVPWADL